MPNNFYGATSLTGGGTGALDAIDGTDLANGDGALVITSNNFYVYTLSATSGAAESSPDVIKPDSNAGDKRWLMVYMFDAIVSNPESGEHQVKNIRYLANADIKYVCEGDAEP